MLSDMILWSLPVAALVWLGGWLVRRTRPGRSPTIFYLGGVLVFLLLVTVAAFWIPIEGSPPLGNRLVFVNGPVILGVLVLLALHLRQHGMPSRIGIFVLLILTIIAIPASRLPWSGDLIGFLTGMLVLALLVYLIPRGSSGYLVLLALVGLAYLFITNTVDRPSILVGNLWPVLSFVNLPLLVIVPAVLVYRALRHPAGAGQRLSARLQLAYLALAALLFVSFTYTIYWYSIWDHTSDGLGGVFFSLLGSIVAVAAGLVLVYLLQGKQRLWGAAFALLVPLSFNQAFERGWQVSYQQLTEDRAAKIEAALERYYADNGAYPENLGELSPAYLLRVPKPVILRSIGWCYRAGEDHYRLGTFYREFFSLPISFRIYAQAGNPPDEWACEETHDDVVERFGSGWVSNNDE